MIELRNISTSLVSKEIDLKFSVNDHKKANVMTNEVG